MSTKVLVFESDAAFAAELRGELAKLGCSTSVVDDGNAGLQQAASDKPDLILLSIELPRMNGFSVCNKLKKDSKLKEVPLIIMSTESSDETFDQHRKLRTRAEDYVHKPIAFGELLQHINQFIQLEGASPQGDAGIVIEDEIQISSIDLEEGGTLVVDDQSAGAAPKRVSHSPKRAASEPPAKMKNVDEDIDAFIEGGFGKMTAPAHGADAPQNGSPAEAKKKSVAPPPEPAAPVNRGEPLKTMAMRDPPSAMGFILAIMCCKNRKDPSLILGNPAPKRPWNPSLSCSVLIVSSTFFHSTPNGGFEMQ